MRGIAFAIAGGMLLPTMAGAAGSSVDYLSDVKPLLERKCYACHGALKQQAGLRLDTALSIREGGKSGPAVTPGDSKQSLLLKLVTATEEANRMPQEASPLTAEEIAKLRRWIEDGAEAPANEDPMEDPRSHWSYQVPRRPPLPKVKNATAVQNPIDVFVAARREAHGLSKGPEAEPAVLLRRVYLDLIGLPPSREVMSRFLADPSPDAYEKIVEDLLASPRYGERWGRHWMDVWRYSDWYGRRAQDEIRYSVRHIWRWRDWIIRSLNEDKGYDRMITEMIAGDEVLPSDHGALAATGFLGRNWYKFDRNVWLFETVEQTSQAFLGLTMRCARCHDHKYDPISQEDYFRFRAIFEPHDIRTEPLDAAAALLLDNKKDAVPADGLSRAFDKDLETPTWIFERGDDRRPDKSRSIDPGIPTALGGALEVEPVRLPVEAFYPGIRKEIVDGKLAEIQNRISETKSRLDEAKKRTEDLEQSLREFQPSPSIGEEAVIWSDNFNPESGEKWKSLSGNWVFSEGKLTQDQVTSFATLVSEREHPRDFKLRFRYRALAPGTVRSIGVSFDYVDKGNSQDIYTSTSDKRQSVHAFHRKEGKQIYPPSGIVDTSLKVGETVAVELEVRGQYLAVYLDGGKKLEYIMPLERLSSGGKLALWVHSGAAEFSDFSLLEVALNRTDLEREVEDTRHAIDKLEREQMTATLELTALRTQVAADRMRFSEPAPPQADKLMSEALRARALVRSSRAQLDAMMAKRHLDAVVKLATTATHKARGDAVQEAKSRIAAAQKLIAEAKDLAANPSGELEPLGELFPKTSSGRRLALANWIASPENPRTARVAVNHLWLRHFGEALVPTVSDFGVSGTSPTHPELLDWLAVELIERDWRMKELHHLMVTSETYRLASWAGPETKNNLASDPDNQWYWRANSRRMEAEVVRDSILSVSGELDTTPFGPDLDDSLGLKTKRRSLYFRTTPDSQMAMLSQFDMANPNACYRREESVAPQQSLALMNGGLALDQSRLLARRLSGEPENGSTDDAFSRSAFEQVINRPPKEAELKAMIHYLKSAGTEAPSPGDEFSGVGEATVPPSRDPALRARENLVHVLFNHNDFVTIR